MGNEGRSWNLSILIRRRSPNLSSDEQLHSGWRSRMTGRGISCGDIVVCPEMEEMKISYDVFVFTESGLCVVN